VGASSTCWHRVLRGETAEAESCDSGAWGQGHWKRRWVWGGAGVKGGSVRAVRAGGASVAQEPSPLPFVASLSQGEKGIEGGE
jgi:hypothetical protein